jgi:DNA polymerase-3 subunit epsilon
MIICSIDFETANHSPVSMCAAGLATFEQGRLTESVHWLVRPPKGHGWFIPEWTQGCHGLSWWDVRHEPEFSAISGEVLTRLARADVVIAHNAPFDLRVLEATLEHFGQSLPVLRSLCTCALSRQVWPQLPNHQLSTVAAHIGHTFQHHHAQSDAEAAGQVLLAMMAEMRISSPEQLLITPP